MKFHGIGVFSASVSLSHSVIKTPLVFMLVCIVDQCPTQAITPILLTLSSMLFECVFKSIFSPTRNAEMDIPIQVKLC